jgi:LysR family pca operon transcriptional activator
MDHDLTGWNRTKLRHLHCVLAIASHGHMGRAAHALGISQPALSKTLSEFEDMLGVRLFTRSRSGVVATEAGQVLLGYAGSSLRTLREGLDHVSSAVRPEAPTIAFGALPTVAQTVAPEAVRLFRQKWPATRFKVHIGMNSELLALLKRGEIDLLLGRLADPSEMLGVSYEHLYAEDVVIVVRPGHPLARMPIVEPHALSPYCMLLPMPATAIRHSIDSFLIRSSTSIEGGSIETMSDSFCRAYVQVSEAIWFMAIGTVEQDLARGTLVRLACDTRHTTGSVGLTLRSDGVRPQVVTELIDCIRIAAAARRQAREA